MTITKITYLILFLIFAYIAVELCIFWYRATHLPTLPSIDQSDRVLGQGRELRYIVAGDSAAVGLGASTASTSFAGTIAQHFATTNTVKYRNIAVVGYRTSDVINNQLSKIIEYKPDVVLISIGANDATHLKSAATILENYKIIKNRLEKETTATVYITNIVTFDYADILPWFFIKYLENRQISENAEIAKLEDERFKIVNIHDFGWDTFPDRRLTFAADHFHPNDLGYTNWTNAFLSRIRN